MFLITASFGFLQPFVPLYWEASGLSQAEIGIVGGIGSGAALLVQPLMGRLSDLLDSRRHLIAAAALGAAAAYFCFQYVSSAAAFAALTAIGVNGTIYLNAAAGVVCGRLGGRTRGGATYAAYRVWGSVGYIVVALLAGGLINSSSANTGMSRAALMPVFRWGPTVFLAVAALAMLIPDPRSVQCNSDQPTPAQADPDSQGDTSGLLRPFLMSFFLYQFALYGASAYLSLYMKALGASPLWITATFASGVVCEVLVMSRIGRLSDALGRKPVLAVAFILMPIRLLCYIPATGPLWVLAVQLLHGLNFGIMGAIAVAYVNDVATDRTRGAAQAALASAGGLAVAIGPALCGLIAHRFGIGWMFGAMSVVGAAGALVFLTRVREPLRHPAMARSHT